jgi:cytidine deaminase
VLFEHAPELVVHAADASGTHRAFALAELLPESFGPADLER